MTEPPRSKSRQAADEPRDGGAPALSATLAAPSMDLVLRSDDLKMATTGELVRELLTQSDDMQIVGSADSLRNPTVPLPQMLRSDDFEILRSDDFEGLRSEDLRMLRGPLTTTACVHAHPSIDAGTAPFTEPSADAAASVVSPVHSSSSSPALRFPPLPQPVPQTGNRQTTGQSSRQDKCNYRRCPTLELADQFGQISTADDILLPSERNNPCRITSQDWVQDFRGEDAPVGKVGPAVFTEQLDAMEVETQRRAETQVQLVDQQTQRYQQQWEQHQHQQQQQWEQQQQHQQQWPQCVKGVEGGGPLPPPTTASSSMLDPGLTPADEQASSILATLHTTKSSGAPPEKNLNYASPLAPRPAGVPPPLPTLTSVPTILATVAPPTSPSSSPSASKTSKRTSKRRKRLVDTSTAYEPTQDDVLFGRGGFTNTHPGNMRFREEALKLRDWYKQSSKEDKYEISDILVQTVENKGHRFLERGSDDGKWHLVDRKGARKKASQALRERTSKKKKEKIAATETGTDATSEVAVTGKFINAVTL